MDTIEINRIIKTDYNKFYNLVKLLETLDNEIYYFDGGINNVDFDDENQNMICVTFSGNIKIPLEYLTMDENELRDKIIMDKNKRLKK